jgi:hypothetical protein
MPLYPMFAENRRQERDNQILIICLAHSQYSRLQQKMDFFLEGRAVFLLIEPPKRRVYPRADEELFIEF